jgi:hypothetical protein
VPGVAERLLAVLLDGSPVGFVYAVLLYLAYLVVRHVVVPSLVSVGRCCSARIEARWMPRDRPRDLLEGTRIGGPSTGPGTPPSR